MAKFKGFTSVELRRPTRSTFDLSHEKRVSSRIGRLCPIFVSETLPNDTFYGSTEVLLKLAPMIAPIYQRMNLYVHYFFVPNRLLWKDWEQFITGGRLGEAVSSPPVPPNFLVSDLLDTAQNALDTGSIADHMGLNPIPDSQSAAWAGIKVDAMPFYAYFKVWYEYYRDRNHQADSASVEEPLPSGTISASTYAGITVIRQRCWEADYYTTALPFTQRGAEVLMPLDGTGTVSYLPFSEVENQTSGLPAAGNITTSGGDPSVLQVGAAGQSLRVVNIDSVDITNSEVSINDLRRAVRLQEWLERNALAGSRYNESIMAHFARKTSDGRLQRPEYLGGGKAVVQVSEIMTTSYSEDASAELIPPASPTGRGSIYSTTNRFSYNCEEHGFVVGILSVMPSTGYMQGWPRMFFQRNTFLDYPWPSFAHLGEQEVFTGELYASPGMNITADRTQMPVFGYQSRYSDWKHMGSTASGDFRSNLDHWHLVRKFSTNPTLGAAFVSYDDENQDRVFNVSGVDTLWMYIYNNVKVKRSLPYFGTPML